MHGRASRVTCLVEAARSSIPGSSRCKRWSGQRDKECTANDDVTVEFEESKCPGTQASEELSPAKFKIGDDQDRHATRAFVQA